MLSYAFTTVRMSLAFLDKVAELEANHGVQMQVISCDGSRQGSPTECACVHLELRGDSKSVEACYKEALALKIDGELPFSNECPKRNHSEPDPEFGAKLNEWIRERRP
jgi:hypothetical protein